MLGWGYEYLQKVLIAFEYVDNQSKNKLTRSTFLLPKVENEYMHEFGEYCDARIVKFMGLSSFNNYLYIIGH